MDRPGIVTPGGRQTLIFRVMKQFAIIFGAAVLLLSGGRIVTRTARLEAARRRAAWTARAESIQAELDAERARGWGFRYCDGRRIDF